MEKRALRLFIIDNSMIYREILPVYLMGEKSIEVVGSSYNNESVFLKLKQLHPDIIVVNVDMSEKEIEVFFMNLNKVVVTAMVVVTSSSDDKAVMALGHGATDYITKPNISKADDLKKFASLFVTDIHRIYNNSGRTIHPIKPVVTVKETPVVKMPQDIIIAIGASTGGVEALVNVITKLPANMPPILITQHMPEKFTMMFAKRLDGLSKLEVSEAVDGEVIKRNHVYVAAGKYHMRLAKGKDGYYITSKQGEKVNGHCPSVEVLFNSVAQIAKNKAIGVILTGMGGDGAQGLLNMKKAGAFTIGQDKESCIVYGMPMVAYELGAVDIQRPLDSIADEIVRHIKV